MVEPARAWRGPATMLTFSREARGPSDLGTVPQLASFAPWPAAPGPDDPVLGFDDRVSATAMAMPSTAAAAREGASQRRPLGRRAGLRANWSESTGLRPCARTSRSGPAGRLARHA